MTTIDFMTKQGYEYKDILKPLGIEGEAWVHKDTNEVVFDDGAVSMHHTYLQGQIEALQNFKPSDMIDQCWLTFVRQRDKHIAALKAELNRLDEEL